MIGVAHQHRKNPGRPVRWAWVAESPLRCAKITDCSVRSSFSRISWASDLGCWFSSASTSTGWKHPIPLLHGCESFASTDPRCRVGRLENLIGFPLDLVVVVGRAEWLLGSRPDETVTLEFHLVVCQQAHRHRRNPFCWACPVPVQL